MSKIATSIEQSKRLLDAGIDPESADMEWVEIEVWNSDDNRMTNKWCLGANPCRLCNHPKYIPAWSLSRLIDIHRNFDYGPMDDGGAAVIDCLVRAICNEIKYETGRVREEFIVKRPLGQPQETEGA